MLTLGQMSGVRAASNQRSRKPEEIMRRMKLLGYAVAGLVLAVAVCDTADAKKKKKKPKLSAEAKDAAKMLESEDASTVLEGVTKLGDLAEPGGAVALIDLLETGPKDKITEAALDALGAISSSVAIPILIEYMNHRRPKVRIIAINAIAEIKDKRVSEALKMALKDSDANVRKAAAYALGRYGDKSAIDILFKAFDRNVPEAAIAIGQIGDVDAMERLSGYMGKAPLDLLKPGLAEFLNREDFPVKGKITIVDKLMELAGPEVKEFLKQYAAGLSEDAPLKLRQKVQEAIESIAD
jgi:HEAT repeat protein